MKIVNQDELRYMPVGTIFIPFEGRNLDMTNAQIIDQVNDNGFLATINITPDFDRWEDIEPGAEIKAEWLTGDTAWFDIDDGLYGVLSKPETFGFYYILQFACKMSGADDGKH